MQRYRVNYRLLISLIVGVVIAAPSGYALWSFQVDRNATRLLAQADAAREESNFQEEYESLHQYVKLRKDDDDAQLRLGRAALEMLKEENDELTMETRSQAYFAIIEAVLRTDDNELRRDLVDIHLAFRVYDRALQSIEELIDRGQADEEVMALKAHCLYELQKPGEAAQWSYQLIGYDPSKQEFNAEKALAPNEPGVYAALARYLYTSGQTAHFDHVLEQMVVANPESYEAFINQYQLLRMLDRPEEAREALEKAYALEPHDAQVILSKGNEAISDYQTAMEEAAAEGADGESLRKDAEQHLDEAAKFFAEGLEEYSDRPGFYEATVRIEMFRQRFDEALAIIEKGLKEFEMRTVLNSAGLPVALGLHGQKMDILFARNDLDAVRSEINMLRDLRNNRVDPYCDYHLARIEVIDQNWLEAARQFKDVKVTLIGSPEMQALASVSQASCHVQLGQYDLALEAFEWALSKNPNLPIAKIGRDEMLRYKDPTGQNDAAAQLDRQVKSMLALPEGQQDWTQLEAQIDELIKRQAELQGASKNWIDSRRDLLRAQMFVTRAVRAKDSAMQRRLFTEAKDAVRRAYALDPDDITIQLAAPRVLMAQQPNGPTEALQLLEAIIAKNKKKGLEETPPFRMLRIELLFVMQDEQLPSQLHAATEGIEKWRPEQQAQLWAAVGEKFERLGRLPDAALCLQEAAKLAPTMLQYRSQLFEIARKQSDDAAMRAAQEQILELVKDKQAPEYVITEVKRMIVSHAGQLITKDELKKARTMLEDAIRRRPGWAELHVLSAHLALVLEQDMKLALTNLEGALKSGATNLPALGLQVRLLAEMGRFADARKLMDQIDSEQWNSLLDRVGVDVLRKVGDNDLAFAEAKKIADASANQAPVQAWFAEVAAGAEKFEDAEKAFRNAVTLSPGNPDFWSAMLSFYMLQKRIPEIEATLREAQLALDEEFAPLITAQQYKLFGRFMEAETIMRASHDERADDVGGAQRMAEFYIDWSEQNPAQRIKAAPYLNRLLRAGYKGELPKNHPAVSWARRQAATIFSLTGDYQDSLKAERILATAVESDAASAEGQELLVDVLTRRGDPSSRQRTVEIIRKIQSQRGLSPKLELQLGKALYDIADWSDCERHMQEAISRHPDDIALRVALIEMLLERKDLGNADRWLSRLMQMSQPQAKGAGAQLQVRLAALKGDKAEVRRLLEAITPAARALTPQQLQMLHAVALLAENVGDTEYALKLIADHEGRARGRGGNEFQNQLELARYTALYGDLNTGLNMLKQMFPDAVDPVLHATIDVYRTRRTDAPEMFDEEVDRMVRIARRDDPDAARRMVYEAESLEIQQKLDEALVIYEELLARDDVPKFVRASGLNNLAFLLAMMEKDLDRALAAANEAAAIIGPISDILDTRGLVYLHREDYVKAVEDLENAVRVDATANKYFHLAAAKLGTGDSKGALAAWEQAELRGLAVDKIPVAERVYFEETKRRIDALRTGPES